MTNFNLIFIAIAVLLLLIGSQKFANLPKSKRYQQVWLPIYAAIFMIVLLNINERYLHDLTAFVFSQFPILEEYTLIVLNLMMLAFFVMTKSVWRNVVFLQQYFKKKLPTMKVGFLHSIWHRLFILLPEKWLKEVTNKNQSVFIVYKNTPKGIIIVPEWLFAKKLFRYTSIFALLMVLCFICIPFFQLQPSIIDFFPRYPILSFIVLAELAWFLGGEMAAMNELKITGDNVHSLKTSQYDTLFEEYKRLWPERILAASKSEGSYQSSPFIYHNLSHDANIQKRVLYLCEKLKRDGLEINGNYIQMVTDILEERDILVEDPVYQELAPYFFSAIYGLLVKNKKLLVITADHESAKAAVQWFQLEIQKQTGLDFVWTIAWISDALEQNIDADILVLSPDQLLNPSFFQFLEKYRDTGITEGVIFLEAEKLLAEYGLLLHVCQKKLEQFMKKRPQYLVFSQWQEDLEHTVRELLNLLPKDRLGSLPKAEKLYYIIWKMDGEETFQSKILSKLVHRSLDPEVTLALPAIKFGVEAIHFPYQNGTTTEESLTEIVDHRIHLQKYGIRENQFVILERNMSVYYQNFSVPIEESGVVIVRDQHFNLIETLKQWYSVGKKSVFVQVVAPSYLLRDYFAQNIKDFLDDSRKFSPIATRVPDTAWKKAYLLLERLGTGFISEEEIRSEILLHGHSEDTLIEALNLYFKNVLHINFDFMHQLSMKQDEIFDKNNQTFNKTIKYFLPEKVKKQLIPDLFHFLEIRTTTGETLGHILAGHFSQKYIVGQYHAFNGQLYQITNLDKRLSRIEVRFEAPIGDLIYRQSRKYKLYLAEQFKGKVDESVPIRFGELEIKKCLLSPKVWVETNGYFSFSKGIQLLDSATQYTELNEDTKKAALRHYPHGNVLLIKISSPNIKFTEPEKLAFSLALLVNECLPTLYPATHSYLAVTTVLSDEFFGDTPFMERLALYTPSLGNVELTNTKEEIYLYLIEDSPMHLGLVESIMENLEHIFEILADYLDWAMKEMNQGYLPFYYYGESKLPELFDLDGTINLLQALTPESKLQELRKHNVVGEILTEEPTIEVAVCDFCGESIAIAEKESLDDERDRCYHCRVTAVDSVNDLIPLYDEVRDYFLFNLKLDVRQDIYVKLLSAGDIQDEPFIPTSGFDARIIGKAIQSSNNQFMILIENGAPKTQTIGTLAHELTHIWQYEQLDLDKFTLEQLEGHAVWTEIHYLESIGEMGYAKKLKASMLEREDEYGKGYRDLLEKLKRYPRGMTPFELYRDKVKQIIFSE
jgi:hypothetical protein